MYRRAVYITIYSFFTITNQNDQNKLVTGITLSSPIKPIHRKLNISLPCKFDII